MVLADILLPPFTRVVQRQGDGGLSFLELSVYYSLAGVPSLLLGEQRRAREKITIEEGEWRGEERRA